MKKNRSLQIKQQEFAKRLNVFYSHTTSSRGKAKHKIAQENGENEVIVNDAEMLY